ncbi:MAG: methyl-accepting chemotaxis protein [Desulfobia sp.]
MRLNLFQKLTIVFLDFLSIPVVMLIALLVVTGMQEDKNLAINLTDRQSMLTQKLTKEAMTYLHQKENGSKAAAAETAEDMKTTMKVFDATLGALLNSGKAPLTLDPSGRQAVLPGAEGKAEEQLNKTVSLWEPFKKNIEDIINGRSAEKPVDYILKNNPALFSSTNKAVGFFQQQYKKITSILLIIEVICLVWALVVFAAFTYLIRTKITSPFQKIVSFSGALARGNLRESLDIKQQGEIGEVAGSLNSMAENLKQTFKDINKNMNLLVEANSESNDRLFEVNESTEDTANRAAAVASAAEQMSNNMDSVAAAMEETTSNVNTVASAAEEMSTNISEISQNAEGASHNTHEAVEKAREASETINQLGTAAAEIGTVTETITAISDKTNLLALNATIEAARAGEAGKGFAVVANEIKDLAQQTAEATDDISQKLKAIQSSTNSSVQGIEEISSSIQEVDDTVSSISYAMEEQNKATIEITKNINQASSGLNEVTENISQASQASRQVAQDISGINEAAGSIQDANKELSRKSGNLTEVATTVTEKISLFTYRRLPFSAAAVKTAHIKWKKRLADMLAGLEEMDTHKLPDHNNCGFGKWYNSEGRKNFSHLSAFKEIEAPHQKIHETGLKIARLYSQNKKTEANQMYIDEMEKAGSLVFEKLDQLERECE